MKKVLLGTALASLVFVPAASGIRSPSVRLAIVPLPKSVIGAAAQSFSLAHDSGRVSNASAAAHTSDATPKTFTKMGRVDGYALEYGNAFTGAAGITAVRTGIEQYKTAADARRALGFWEKEDAQLSKLDNPDFSVTSVPVDVPAPAARTSHFAYLTSYSASDIAPVSGLDEQVADGPYVLDIIVTAGVADTAEALAPQLARKLDARLRLARKGRLHAKPVKLPRQKVGPPPGGPDLSVLALHKSDLVGKASVTKEYVGDPAAISDLQRVHAPGGPVRGARPGDRVVSGRERGELLRGLRERDFTRAEGDHGARPEQPRRRRAGKRHRGLQVRPGAGVLLVRPACRVHLHGRQRVDQQRRRHERRAGGREPDRRRRAR